MYVYRRLYTCACVGIRVFGARYGLNTFLKFNIFTIELVQIMIFNMTLYNLLGGFWCSGRTYCLCNQYTQGAACSRLFQTLL